MENCSNHAAVMGMFGFVAIVEAQELCTPTQLKAALKISEKRKKEKQDFSLTGKF